MRTNLPLATLVLAAAALVPGTLPASGGTRVEAPEADAPRSPEDSAAEHYNLGLAERDLALRLREKAAGTTGERADKLEKKIAAAYQRAIRHFGAALEANPRMHEAHGSLGFALRQTGDYAAALEAYDAALDLSPDYAPALEYRAEAYLGLNRLGEAQRAHGDLVEADPALADRLLQAMRAWVAQRREQPGPVKIGELDAFERWIDGQATHAEARPTKQPAKSRSW